MTTFQYIVDAILHGLAQLVPVQPVFIRDFYENALKWPESSLGLQLQVSFVAAACFLVFFRYDWLGLFSALIKSIAQPASLRADRRTLDQQIVLSLTLITVPALLASYVLRPLLLEHEILTHPFVMASIFFIVAGLLQFATGWNKRLQGLNHLRIVDSLVVTGLALLSAHPAFSLVALLWIGFAITNYHFDAIFKYSMLIIGFQIFTQLFYLLREISPAAAITSVGPLNTVAILVVSFTTVWMTLESLQRNLSESTLHAFKWFSLMYGLFYVVIYFVRG